MRRKVIWALIGLLIAIPIVVAIVGTKVFQFQSMAEAGAQFVMPPEPVNVLPVQEAQWHPEVSSVGSVMAVQGTVVSTEAEGVVQSIHFQPGSMVEQGDVLLQLDADVERAQLLTAEVEADWARTIYRRSTELSKSRHISDAELDEAANAVRQAEAQVAYLRALMDRKTIRAPFSGKLGILEVSVGRFLPKGSPVVSLQALDPVFVEFSLPQQHLGDLMERLEVAVTSDAYRDRHFHGRVTAINPQLDRETRNVRVQATLDNPDGHLRPGMFVTVDMVLDRTESAVMVPATAIQYGPRGTSVFVVEEAGGEPSVEGLPPEVGSESAGDHLVVAQRDVRLGVRRGDFVVVLGGISVGDLVVSTGVFKLRPGMAVVIDNTLAPEFSLSPSPNNT